MMMMMTITMMMMMMKKMIKIITSVTQSIFKWGPPNFARPDNVGRAALSHGRHGWGVSRGRGDRHRHGDRDSRRCDQRGRPGSLRQVERNILLEERVCLHLPDPDCLQSLTCGVWRWSRLAGCRWHLCSEGEMIQIQVHNLGITILPIDNVSSGVRCYCICLCLHANQQP